MLEEAVMVMRELWRGELTNHRGTHYTVENARLYTLPEDPIEVQVAAGGPEAAELAARIGGGIVSTSPDRELLEAYIGAGGRGGRFAQVTVCWAESREEAVRTALEWWPNGGLRGTLALELPLPSHFEAAATMVSESDIAEAIACGPDPEVHVEKIAEYLDAGYDQIYVHQVGADQDGFLRFYEREVMPALAGLGSPASV
jgi:G6PDH family F420-dependent oxidoreductase